MVLRARGWNYYVVVVGVGRCTGVQLRGYNSVMRYKSVRREKEGERRGESASRRLKNNSVWLTSGIFHFRLCHCITLCVKMNFTRRWWRWDRWEGEEKRRIEVCWIFVGARENVNKGTSRFEIPARWFNIKKRGKSTRGGGGGNVVY